MPLHAKPSPPFQVLVATQTRKGWGFVCRSRLQPRHDERSPSLYLSADFSPTLRHGPLLRPSHCFWKLTGPNRAGGLQSRPAHHDINTRRYLMKRLYLILVLGFLPATACVAQQAASDQPASKEDVERYLDAMHT